MTEIQRTMGRRRFCPPVRHEEKNKKMIIHTTTRFYVSPGMCRFHVLNKIATHGDFLTRSCVLV